MVRGVSLLLAVAIFAVSYHPIRHAADVKPYASDLFAAVIVLARLLDWLCRPEEGSDACRTCSRCIARVVLGLSHPSVFVVGGVIVGLAPAVVRDGRRSVWIAYLSLDFVAVVGFLVLYLTFTRHQASASLVPMQVEWMAGFPPLHDVATLARWFVTVHTGDVFAYPCGGERGASILSLALFIVGAVAMWRCRRKVILLTCLAPFGLALMAAAIRRYPYGGVTDGSPARVMQYLVPSICLLAGVGGAALLASDPRARATAGSSPGATGLAVLAGIGIAPC